MKDTRTTDWSRGFTLIELLVVIAVIALLVSILMPSLQRAKDLAKSASCKMNLRTLQQANEMYASTFDGHYVPGAADFLSNRQRWFGSRETDSGPFVSQDGPLGEFLPGKEVRDCPSFTDSLNGFEAGCGGYGYNNNFVGQMRSAPDYDFETDLAGNLRDRFAKPIRTVAFTDAAFVDGGLTEYSFVESPEFPYWGGSARPSIHFRHIERTNVAWLDGHVSDEEMSFSNDASGGFFEGSPADFNVVFFGPESNELFDCE